jgi:hypothetical protein
LEPGAPPPPPSSPPLDENGEPQPFFPYKDREEFRLASFLFKQNQMPGTQIDELMDIWSNTLLAGEDPPFADHADLYEIIDATVVGDAPWQSFSVNYCGDLPEDNVPPWMLADYDVWHRDPRVVLRNQLANADFKGEFDYAPFQKFDDTGKREWKDFMSANWAYKQAVRFFVSYRSFYLLNLDVDRILLQKIRQLMGHYLSLSF